VKIEGAFLRSKVARRVVLFFILSALISSVSARCWRSVMFRACSSNKGTRSSANQRRLCGLPVRSIDAASERTHEIGRPCGARRLVDGDDNERLSAPMFKAIAVVDPTERTVRFDHGSATALRLPSRHCSPVVFRPHRTRQRIVIAAAGQGGAR
jgi:hypothetical protein